MGNNNIVEPLFQQVEEFAKSQLELMKLKFLDKIAHIVAQFITWTLLFISFLFCCIFFSNAMAIWIGDLLGVNYYGYLCVALFYALITFAVWRYYTYIKSKLNDWLVRKMFT